MGHGRAFVKRQCTAGGKDRLYPAANLPGQENSDFLLALWFDFL